MQAGQVRFENNHSQQRVLHLAGVALTGILLAIASLAMIVLPWLAWRWTRQPFPGILFGPSYVASAMSPSSWEGARLGIWPPDQLRAVDGSTLQDSFDLERIMSGHRPGEQVVLTLHRPDGTERRVSVTLVQIGWLDLFVYMGLPYLVGLAYLAIGVWVYSKRHAHVDGRAVAIFCAVTSIAVSGMFENSSTHVFSWLWSACISMAPGALTALALVFPQELSLVRRWPFMRWLPYLLSLGLALAEQPEIYNLANQRGYETVWNLSLVYFLFSAVLFYARIGYLRIRSNSPTVRQQSRVILLGSLAAFAPFAAEVGFNLLTRISLPIPAPLYVAPGVMWPLALAYAVLRYRLWDIDLIINRGLVYGTLTVFLAGAYFALLAVFTRIAMWLTGQAGDAAAVFLTTAILALFFIPARNAIQAAIDRLFYRDRLDLRAAQREISQTLSTTLTLEGVVQLLTDLAPQRLRLQRATLWLNTPKGPVPHPPESPLAVESAPLVIPLKDQGVYAVGMSLAERPPNREESDLLTVLGNAASVALENVRLAAQLADQARIEQEMDIARETQLSLLPAAAPQLPGWEIAGQSQPASEVGGDFFIYHPMPDGGLGLSVGDVSGKGMSAALLMSGSVIALAAVCENDPAPADLLRQMDRVLQPYHGGIGRNTALCYVRLPASQGGPRVVCAANAGMVSPLVRRVNGQVGWLNVRGLPLGAPHIGSAYFEASATIEPGDMVVIASDGIIERMNPQSELFGFERFEQVVAGCSPHLTAQQVCQRILEQVEAYAAPALPHDDMTLVVLCAR